MPELVVKACYFWRIVVTTLVQIRWGYDSIPGKPSLERFWGSDCLTEGYVLIIRQVAMEFIDLGSGFLAARDRTPSAGQR